MNSLWKIVSWVIGILVTGVSGAFYVGQFVATANANFATVNAHTEQLTDIQKQIHHLDTKVDLILDRLPEKPEKGVAYEPAKRKAP